MEFNFAYVFLAIFAFVVGSLAFKFIRHGGFKAAMFGAGIKNTVGEVSGSGKGVMTLSLKVHELDDAPNKAIGVEFVAKSVASYQMMPITLSASEAQKLAELISRAVEGKPGT